MSVTLSSEASVRAVPGVELVVVERRGVAHHPLLSDQSLSIGRAQDCDIVLRDRAASRRHAMIRSDGGLSVEDLSSRNGTRVSGATIVPHQRAALCVGDSIQIGGTTLLVRNSARSEVCRLNAWGAAASGAPGALLADAKMRAVFDLVQRVAPSTVTILVLGDTGVGKELVAEAIHRASGARSAKPLVRINCATLPSALVESELFGYERGAFSGAALAKPGLLEVADRGTVFFDEIGELPLAAQAKLLRVLEAR